MPFNLSGIFLILVLVLINAFFAASEIAVISARRVRIEQLREKGSKSAEVLIKLIENPSLFLATIQVGVTLAGFLASAIAAVGLSQNLAQFFKGLGIPVALSNNLGVVVITLIVSFITLVFGELAPKRLALQWSERIALIIARPINFIAKATFPVTRLLTLSTNLLVTLFGGNPRPEEQELTEDDIRLHIAENKTLAIEEKRMIEAVFEFGDQVVRQVMVPRTEIFFININDRVQEALEKICHTGYSAFPVYKEDQDDVVGMIRIQDLACRVVVDQDQKVEDIMSPVLFIPETKDTVELLKEFRAKNIETAVVVDEYGGTVGLVTLEDLVDEIIGDLIQEHRFMRKASEGQWLVEGNAPIEEIVDTLKLKRIPPDPDFETIAGFLLKQLGHLPTEGETVSWEGYNFQVKEIGNRRIKKVLITANPGRASS